MASSSVSTLSPPPLVSSSSSSVSTLSPPLVSSSSSSSSCSSSWESSWNTLPEDIAMNITFRLNVMELCSLGGCSRHLRDICASDCLWINLSRKRWPSVDLLGEGDGSDAANMESSAAGSVGVPLPSYQRWKDIYIQRHKEIADGVSTVVAFVKHYSQNESLHVEDYLKVVEDLGSMELGFEDVKMLLFPRKNNALLNLIGLHYAMFHLGIPAHDVNEALHHCQISTREVLVLSFTLGRLFFGLRLPDKCFSHSVSLSELTTIEHEEVLAILNRGVLHQVLHADMARNWGKEFLDCIKLLPMHTE